jgi:8-oxo-dGTP diphosphatase
VAPAGQQIGVNVAVVLMTIADGALKTLLATLGRDLWALPHGEPGYSEPLQDAAARIIGEQLGLRADYLEQLFTFGSHIPKNRQRRITVAYYALTPAADLRHRLAGGLKSANWFSPDELPKLVDGHAEIVRVARRRLRGKLAYTAVGFELLPEKFSLAELQTIYEVILGKTLDKRNFRRKIKELGIVEELGGEFRSGPRGRAAQLHRFKPEMFQRIEGEVRGDILAF